MTSFNEKKTTSLSFVLFFTLLLSLTASLFFKDQRLWLDELFSYLLVSDPSITHLNDALVSSIDANPPLFTNLYWLLGHSISLNPVFLKVVSIALFALAIALFYRYTTRLIGSPVTNFVLFTLVIGLTYLNYTLSTQIRTYSLFLLVTCLYFIANHRLIQAPDKLPLLAAHLVTGLAVTLTHNFGLFYAAASGAFFALLWLTSRQKAFLWVLASHLLILLLWLLIWYPNFAIQSQAGKPHSWIPLPTFLSFFQITAEAIPTFSAKLERTPALLFVPILRVGALVALFFYIAFQRLRLGWTILLRDRAFSLFVLSGFIFCTVTLMVLVVSFVHTSVFLSRYMWPSHLLVLYLLVYGYYYFLDFKLKPKPAWALPLYVLLLAPFLFFQNKKITLFPGELMNDLAKLNKAYPVFFEAPHYFLPARFYCQDIKSYFLLDWKTAAKEGNLLNATVDYKVAKDLKEKYSEKGIITTQEFTKANFPHFYVIDEASRYQMEYFIEQKMIRVVNTIPMNAAGNRILECSF